jgi:hypothetical protein
MRLAALGGVVLLASAQMGGQAVQTTADKSQFVINLENTWSQAEKLGDGRVLALLLAETFVNTDDDGSFTNRDEWLIKARISAKGYRSLANVEQTAHVYGNTVVVTGVYLEKMKGEKNVERRGRFTDTWIFQNKRWECVASQSTLAAP